MTRVIVICLFISLILTGKVLASEPVHISKLQQKVHVRNMDQYIDTKSNLSYSEFVNNRELFFAPSRILQGTRNLNYTYWMTFTLIGEMLEREHFYLLCTDNRISEMEMWIDGQAQTIGPIGRDFQFDNRNVSHRSLLYALPQKKELEIVVKIRSNQSTYFAFEVKSDNQFLSDSIFESGLIGSTYGIIIIAIFFNLFMLLKFRESIYITYPVFASVVLIIFLFLDGVGFQYVWSESPAVNLYLLLFLPILLMLSLASLVLSVLDAWDKNNPFFKIIFGSIAISQIGYVFVFTMPQYFIHNAFYMLPFVVMLYSCIQKYRSGLHSILAFIIGFIFVILTNSIYMLQPFFAAEHSNYLIQFSPHVGVIALTIAMTYSHFMKFYYLRESRKLERKKSIEQLKQLNQIKDSINEEIALKVAQQTKELARKNAVIHEQNAELQEANDKLKEQTDQIVNLNLQLNQENLELKSDVLKITESRILQNTIPFEDFKLYFKSDDTCYRLLEDLKWQDGFECLKCGNTKYGKGKGELARRCTKCGTNESVTSNTIFHRIHFPISKGFYILFLINKFGDNLISKDLSEMVDLRLATCWKFSKKVKERRAELEKEGKVIESWIDLI